MSQRREAIAQTEHLIRQAGQSRQRGGSDLSGWMQAASNWAVR
jgi:hypothetical protein